MYYKASSYELLGFERSHLPMKKYNAILRNRITGAVVRVPFGAVGYGQFKDSTGLGIYSRLDHNDPTRRNNFHARQIGYVKPGYFSPSYFSLFYLW